MNTLPPRTAEQEAALSHASHLLDRLTEPGTIDLTALRIDDAVMIRDRFLAMFPECVLRYAAGSA